MIVFKNPIISIFRRFLFDIGDFISLGFLSRRYIDRYLAYGPLTIQDDDNGMREHLFVSRILTSGPYLKESEAFQELVSAQIHNWPDFQSEIERYWKKFPVESNYWREVLSQKTKVE